MSKRDVRQIANIPLPAHDYSGAVERLFADMTDEDWLVHAEIHRMMMADGLDDDLWWFVILGYCHGLHGADSTGDGSWYRAGGPCSAECARPGCREQTVSVIGLTGVYGDHNAERVPDALSFEAIEQDRHFTIGVDW